MICLCTDENGEDYVHHEYPDFFVVNVHPGVLETAMDVKTKAAGVIFPYDTGQ